MKSSNIQVENRRDKQIKKQQKYDIIERVRISKWKIIEINRQKNTTKIRHYRKSSNIQVETRRDKQKKKKQNKNTTVQKEFEHPSGKLQK